jgi:hypothetical protein
MSRTGDALEALFDALTAKAAEPDPRIPAPLQNEDLPARLADMGSGLQMLLNVGLIVSDGHMLHIEERRESCVVDYGNAPWKHRLIGIYRHADVR